MVNIQGVVFNALKLLHWWTTASLIPAIPRRIVPFNYSSVGTRHPRRTLGAAITSCQLRPNTL